MPQSPLPPADLSPDSPLESRQTPPAPITAVQDHLPSHTEAEVATARGYVNASRAPGTRKAYAADWRRFTAWCHARHAQGPFETLDAREAPPPSTLAASPALVAIYLAALAAQGKAPPSIGRALAAIAHAYKRAGEVPPHRAASGGVLRQETARVLLACDRLNAAIQALRSVLPASRWGYDRRSPAGPLCNVCPPGSLQPIDYPAFVSG